MGKNVSDTCWIRVNKNSLFDDTSWNALKISSEDVWLRRIHSSWSRCLEDVFITTNVCWEYNQCTYYISFICSQNRLTALSLCECKLVSCLVLWSVYVERIYSLIVKDLKSDWSIPVTWKRRATGKSYLFRQTIHWAYSLVQQNESWQILQLLPSLIPVGAGGLLSRNRLLLCYSESLFIAEVFFIICVFKNFPQFTGKHLCWSLFLII